jgi:hypothetical protein
MRDPFLRLLPALSSLLRMYDATLTEPAPERVFSPACNVALRRLLRDRHAGIGAPLGSAAQNRTQTDSTSAVRLHKTLRSTSN